MANFASAYLIKFGIHTRIMMAMYGTTDGWAMIENETAGAAFKGWLRPFIFGWIRRECRHRAGAGNLDRPCTDRSRGRDPGCNRPGSGVASSGVPGCSGDRRGRFSGNRLRRPGSRSSGGIRRRPVGESRLLHPGVR